MLDPKNAAKSMRVKACTHCRGHKLRCDAREDYSKPCSRCSRLKLNCVVQRAPAKPKRSSKAEIENELSRIKTNLHPEESTGAVAPAPIPAAPETVNRVSVVAAPQQSQPLPEKDDFDPVEISDCFDIFIKSYASQISMMNSTLSPAQCYAQSPLLYWTIACTGSRKYSKNPTLLALLASRVADAVGTATLFPDLHSIQAFMVLCNWSLPIDTLGKETSTLLSALMLQAAITKGLHIRGVGQDFSRMTLTPNADLELARARLWVACVITSQRIHCSYGLPPATMPHAYGQEPDESSIQHGLPADLLFELEISRIITAANLELGQVVLRDRPAKVASDTKSVVNIFLSQLSRVGTRRVGVYGKYHLTCAQLQVSSYHLFMPQALADETSLSKTHRIACEVIETCTDLDTESQFAYSAPDYCSKMLHLAASIILRLARSTISPQIDLERGRAAYFSAIMLFRKMSVQVGDIMARSSIILTQLWTSTTIFVQPDGSLDSFRLLCRTRYAMSSVFDIWWRWRNEFAGQPHPYLKRSDDTALQENPRHQDQQQGGISTDLETAFDINYNYDWNALFSGPADSWDLFNLDSTDLVFDDTLMMI